MYAGPLLSQVSNKTGQDVELWIRRSFAYIFYCSFPDEAVYK